MVGDAAERFSRLLETQSEQQQALAAVARFALDNRWYSRLALQHPALVDMLITEVRNLPADWAAAALRAQRDYVDEWVALLMPGAPRTPTAPPRVSWSQPQ